MAFFKAPTFVCALACILSGNAVATNAQESAISAISEPQIDYDGFAALTESVRAIRAERLLAKDTFFARAQENDALILDTRSAAAFEMGHIAGAVNLPFSDFTDEKLRAVIGDNPNRPIFIYCNNNFSDNMRPIALKRAPLALNIPTFINLHGYGYTNVWELDGVMSVKDIDWVGIDLQLQSRELTNS